MTEKLQFIATEDLTSEHIEHLMRNARRERSIMAHKIFGMIFSAFSTALITSLVSMAQLVRKLARGALKRFGPPEGPTPGSKGVSHV